VLLRLNIYRWFGYGFTLAIRTYVAMVHK